jgi:hypothetical protein
MRETPLTWRESLTERGLELLGAWRVQLDLWVRAQADSGPPDLRRPGRYAQAPARPIGEGNLAVAGRSS